MSRQFQPSAHAESKPATTSTRSRLLQSSWGDREPSPQSERAAPPPVLHEAMNIPVYPTDRPIIQPKLTIGPVGDKYEQEADRIAAQVVNQINAPQSPQRSEAIQRQENDEEAKLQMKPALQNPSLGIPAPPGLEAAIGRSRNSGQPLAENIRTPMERAFSADFSGVRVHTDAQADQLNRSIQAKAFTTRQDIFFRQGVYHPGNREGQRLIAHELTHVVQQTAHGTGHLQRWDMDNPPIGDPERDPRLRHLQPRTARQRYREFIDNAERYGMPVRFLRYVERNYSIASGGSDAVTPAINLMSLEEETLQIVEHMSPILPFGEGTGIQTVYHESTHAYLDLTSGEQAVSDVIRQGEAYYEDAPLEGGRTGDDPERIFQEAAASYVGHRVSVWWSAFENLSMAAAGQIPDARLAQWIDRTRNEYNNRMAERTFGYQETGGFLGFGTSQTETTRQMSQQLKDFLDNQLLEGKIPDNFDNVAGFWELIEQATIIRMSEDTSQTDRQIQPKRDLISAPVRSPIL